DYRFNGSNPFGHRDPSASTNLRCGTGSTSACGLAVDLSSAASQSVGPPGNGTEMAWDGRPWRKIGRQMISLTPLGPEKVESTDRLLGGLAAAGTGLTTSYAALIQAAFSSNYWGSSDLFNDAGSTVAGPQGTNTGIYTQMEWNFSMFFGLAVQAYEQTL